MVDVSVIILIEIVVLKSNSYFTSIPQNSGLQLSFNLSDNIPCI